MFPPLQFLLPAKHKIATPTLQNSAQQDSLNMHMVIKSQNGSLAAHYFNGSDLGNNRKIF